MDSFVAPRPVTGLAKGILGRGRSGFSVRLGVLFSKPYIKPYIMYVQKYMTIRLSPIVSIRKRLLVNDPSRSGATSSRYQRLISRRP